MRKKDPESLLYSDTFALLVIEPQKTFLYRWLSVTLPILQILSKYRYQRKQAGMQAYLNRKDE